MYDAMTLNVTLVNSLPEHMLSLNSVLGCGTALFLRSAIMLHHRSMAVFQLNLVDIALG